MTSLKDECDLFRTLRKAITTDMVACGVPTSCACAILNWFSPCTMDYLTRVSDWQSLLCKGYLSGTVMFPPALFALGVIKRLSPTVIKLDYSKVGLIKQVHQVAKLFYKFDGIPRKKTDLESVKQRLSHPCSEYDSEYAHALAYKLNALCAPRKWESLIGKYGPGVTADGFDEVRKWGRYGVYPYNVPITLFISSIYDYMNLPPIKRCRYGITKVAEVPKTLKSKRIVSSEPANFMFAQLAVARHMMKELHRAFPDHVFLHDSTKHNELLMDPEFCSIDLSDASDHISRRLVWSALPEWREYLFSVRSSFAQFPDRSICPLRTFAPMGSGVCFVVLTAICVGACSICCTRPFHVYGDDIIVHYRDYVSVCEFLTSIGLKINWDKSCCNKHYRESCGLEMLGSTDITPCYLRSLPQQMTSSSIEVVAAKLQSIQWSTTLDRLFELVDNRPRIRYNVAYQRHEVEVVEKYPITAKTHLYGTNGLNRWFCITANSSMVYLGSVRTKFRRIFQSCEIYPYLVSKVCNLEILNSNNNDVKGR